MTADFIAALSERPRSYLRRGGSGEGYVHADLELKLESWAALFCAKQFRDGWIDFGFGQKDISRPDEALVEALDAFVDEQHALALAIPPIVFLSVPMLRESFEGFPTEPVLRSVSRPNDLYGLLQPYAIHANRIAPDRYVIGAFFFSAWDDNIGLGFLFHEGRIIAAGEAQLAETTWMAKAAFEGTLTLENAYWLPPTP